MARRHRGNLEYIWRGVQTIHWPNGNEQVIYHGPYAAKGHIRMQPYYRVKNTFTIQRSKLDWETVEAHEIDGADND